MDDNKNNVKSSSITDSETIDTLGIDDEDCKSEIHILGYEAYLKAQGIILEPGNEFASMVGL